jgi:hypothetical protein
VDPRAVGAPAAELGGGARVQAQDHRREVAPQLLDILLVDQLEDVPAEERADRVAEGPVEGGRRIADRPPLVVDGDDVGCSFDERAE